MKSKGKAILVKISVLDDGQTVERIIHRGHLKECKDMIPPTKKDRFRIDFKGVKK